MRRWVQQESVGIGRQVGGWHGFQDVVAPAEQDSTALARL
jgi:hypothetical protein